jgi:hypothetical protein
VGLVYQALLARAYDGAGGGVADGKGSAAESCGQLHRLDRFDAATGAGVPHDQRACRIHVREIMRELERLDRDGLDPCDSSKGVGAMDRREEGRTAPGEDDGAYVRRCYPVGHGRNAVAAGGQDLFPLIRLPVDLLEQQVWMMVSGRWRLADDVPEGGLPDLLLEPWWDGLFSGRHLAIRVAVLELLRPAR